MRFSIYIIGLLFLSSCVTNQVFQSAKRTGQWDAKAQLLDEKTGKTNQVNLEIVGVWPDRLRLDATATMGISVASLTVNDDQFQMALPRQKKFYQGHASEKVLRSVFQIPLNPRWLLNLCFDQPIQESGWTCENDAQGVVQKCERSSDHMTVTWTDRQGEQKRVIVHAAGHELQIVYKNFSEWDSTKVQDNPSSEHGPFHLAVPDGFATYNIN